MRFIVAGARGRESVSVAAFLALLASLAPLWVLDGHSAGYPLVAMAAASLAQRLGRWARMVLPFGAALGVYGVMQQAPLALRIGEEAVRFLFPLVVLGLLAARSGRRALGATMAAVWLSGTLGAVAWVLRPGPWGDDDEVLRLLAAIGWGATAWCTCRRAICGGAVTLVAALVFFAGGVGALRNTVVGGTGEVSLPLPPSVLAVPAPATVAALERLRAAGFADAAHAWVGMAVQQAAMPDVLRRFCPKGDEEALAPGWQAWVRLGKKACAAVAGAPELGVGALASARHPALLRLRADLLAEMGDIAGMANAYHEAAHAGGDAIALRAGVAALLARNRRDEAVALADPADALTGLWLRPTTVSAEAWQAYNQALDLRGLRSPRRVGVGDGSYPSLFLPVFDPVLGDHVLAVVGRRLDMLQRSLPLPPGGMVPRRIRVLLKIEHGFALRLRSVAGAAVDYECAVAPPAGGVSGAVVSLPVAGCVRHKWQELVVMPRTHLQGPLLSMVLAGAFELAAIWVEGPQAPTADARWDAR